jgi:hypothetical protein
VSNLRPGFSILPSVCPHILVSNLRPGFSVLPSVCPHISVSNLRPGFSILPSVCPHISVSNLRPGSQSYSDLLAFLTVHPQNVRFQNVRFQNVRFQNIRNVRLTKRHIYKTSGLQNVRFTKCQVYKTSGLQNVRLQKNIHIYSVLVVGGNPHVLSQPSVSGCLSLSLWMSQPVAFLIFNYIITFLLYTNRSIPQCGCSAILI